MQRIDIVLFFTPPSENLHLETFPDRLMMRFWFMIKLDYLLKFLVFWLRFHGHTVFAPSEPPSKTMA